MCMFLYHLEHDEYKIFQEAEYVSEEFVRIYLSSNYIVNMKYVTDINEMGKNISTGCSSQSVKSNMLMEDL